MKNLTPFLFLLITFSFFAQSPEKMSYQAVIRDATNTLLTNQPVGMQISILQTTTTGTAVYTETQTVTTNTNGLVSLEIGMGDTSDDFSAIDWKAGPYFIKTETDPTGGSSYTITGTSQLLSVPFAMYAKSSGSSETNATNIANNTISIETNTIAIELNTAKVGITAQQASDIISNNAKTVITAEQSDAIAANTAKTGITSDQATAITANTAKVGYTEASVTANTAVAVNTLKVGITAQQASDITSNNAKTGITSDQADAIIANTSGIATNMTNAQRQAISNPAAGLQVFVTDFDGGSFMFYDGTKWGTLSFTKTIPDAPTIGTATLGNAQATVPFTAPSSDGGSAITSYTATSSPGAITGTISQSGSGSIIVTGLTNSTAYTFTVTATNVFGTSLASGASNSVTPQVAVVGDFYGGGVVFYIFGSGDTGYIAGETHGLIAAVQDQSSGIRWYNGSNTTTGATATTIGTGSANTDAIIAAQGATETSYAAGLARAYTGGGYTDWFLPSKDELNKMYLNRATINTTAASNSGSDFGNSYYWSSTEVDGDYAWSHSFTSGVQYSLIKNYTFYVRAVRAF